MIVGDLYPSAVSQSVPCWGGTDLHWAQTIVTPPPCEPVSLTQVKRRLRIVHDADDADLMTLIPAARVKVEADTSTVLVSATLTQTVDMPPLASSVLLLVRWPVQAIVSVTTYGTDGTATIMDPASYRLDNASRPARLILGTGVSWPTMVRDQGAVTVQFTAGFCDQPPMTIQDLTWAAGIATVKMSGSPQFAVGDLITIRGADQDVYNDTFVVKSKTGNNVTVAIPTVPGWPDPVSPATGTLFAIAPLKTPATLQLAVLSLVDHWHDGLRAGLTTDGAQVPLPFGYDYLVSDRLEWLT